MSLQVWLPLNGDLRNQGCTDYTITAFEASPTFTAGKIGQCYQRANTSSQITNGLQIQDNLVSTLRTAASVAVWVKPLGTHTHYNGTILSSGDWNKKRWAFGVSQDNSQVDVLCGGYNNYISCPVPVNQWTHLVSTFENGVCKLYKNGVYVGEKSGQAAFDSDANWTGICRETYAGGYFGFNGCINDLRIYDHCLSAAEVREIAQGLVLHYKLDQPANINNNLYIGSQNFTGTWINSSAWTTATETYQNFTVKQKSTTWGGLAQNISCTQGDIFTISFWGKVDSGGNIQSVHRSNLGNVTTGLTILGGNFSSGFIWVNNSEDGTQWKRYWGTVQITGSDVTYLQWRLENSVSSKNFYICGIKLEKGAAPSAWSPAASEAGETNIIYDNSGYGHHGTASGIISLSSDTARYSCSTVFNGSNTKIQVPNLTPSELTISFWMKRNANTGTRQFMYTAWSGITCELSTNGTPTFAVYRTNYPTITGTAITTDSGWVHYCATFDTVNGSKLYQNGILKSSNNNVTPIAYSISTNYIGYYNTYYNGLMSDFRIYATALSADDILELYHTGAKIDNKGGTHAYEFIEHQDNILFPAELSRTKLEFTNGLSRYTQANCQVNLVEDGYHIYRPPNLTQSANGNTMWGGLQLVNQSVNTVAAYDTARDNWWHLQQNHTYIAAFHARGKSSNATTWSWTNNMGWGGGGVQPSPTTIVNEGIPADFNGEKDCFYIFKITDAISKPCTTAYSAYVAGTTYLSYRHLTFGWGYTSTGALGTDLYLTNFRLYDITSNMAQFTKQGQANFYDIIEQMDKAKIRKNSELLSSEFLEL